MKNFLTKEQINTLNYMENKLETELNLITTEIKELITLTSTFPALTNKVEQIKFGMNISNLQSLKESFYRFYKLADVSFLTEEAEELYATISTEKTGLNTMLKSLESPSEDILRMLNKDFQN